MRLVDMHHEPGEGADTAMPVPSGEYPCGLRLTLQEAQLKALGLGLPPAGTTLHLEARAVVTRSSTEDPDADGDIDYVCVELQLTELGLESEDEEGDEDALERLERTAKGLYEKGAA